MSHAPCQCQCCVSWSSQGICTEITSPCYGGDISPFHLACPKYISRFQVFAPKAMKRKKWHKVKTMEDLDMPGARLY